MSQLSYWTYQAPGNTAPTAAASYQLQLDINGGAEGGFTTLVYEPYWNGVVVPATWQQWDVDAGQFWSSRTVTDGTCSLVAGAGGPPLYTLATLKTLCPNAEVLGIGVNIGTFNPSYTVATDGVTFNDTTYDFEVGLRPVIEGRVQGRRLADVRRPCVQEPGRLRQLRQRAELVGKTQRISRPRPRWPRASTVPPAEATTCFTIASPSPVPRVCRERSAR